MSILKFIESNENLAFSFENQFKRFSYLTFFPVQVNCGIAEIKDQEGNTNPRAWFQFVSYYKSSFVSVDDNGVVGDNNASVKMLFVKISPAILNKSKFSGEYLRDFFNKHYVGKKFLTLPVCEEGPVFSMDIKTGLKTPLKNQSQVLVDENFDLRSFVLEVEAISDKNKK